MTSLRGEHITAVPTAIFTRAHSISGTPPIAAKSANHPESNKTTGIANHAGMNSGAADLRIISICSRTPYRSGSRFGARTAAFNRPTRCPVLGRVGRTKCPLCRASVRKSIVGKLEAAPPCAIVTAIDTIGGASTIAVARSDHTK